MKKNAIQGSFFKDKFKNCSSSLRKVGYENLLSRSQYEKSFYINFIYFWYRTDE